MYMLIRSSFFGHIELAWQLIDYPAVGKLQRASIAPGTYHLGRESPEEH